MIATANAKLREIDDPSYPKIEGWESILAPSDLDFPVPEIYENPADPGLRKYLEVVKTRKFYETGEEGWVENTTGKADLPEGMIQLDARFKNLDFLRTVELGELGALIEMTVHNWMHIPLVLQDANYNELDDLVNLPLLAPSSA